MLNKKFYTQYKGALSPTVFYGDISSLYDTIQKAHEKYDEDIKLMSYILYILQYLILHYSCCKRKV